MTKFSDFFATYADYAAYIAARDQFVEKNENDKLQLNQAGAGVYGFNGVAYTIGYGYDISRQTGPGIQSDFNTASIFTPANTNSDASKGAIGTYSALYTLIQNYGQGDNSTKLPQLDAAFTTAFGTNGLTKDQANALFDAANTRRYEPALKNTIDNADAGQNGFTIGNNGLHLVLIDEIYASVFGPAQEGYIASNNIDSFIYDVIFLNNTSTNTNTKATTFNVGYENRRINDLATGAGLPATTLVTGTDLDTINFGTNYTVAYDVASTIIVKYSQVTTRISTLVGYGGSQDNLNKLVSSILTNAESVLIAQGNYIVQPTDKSVAGIVASNAGAFTNVSSINVTQVISDINGLTSSSTFPASGTTLSVPDSIVSLTSSAQALSSTTNAYFYDLSQNVIVRVHFESVHQRASLRSRMTLEAA